MARSLRWLAALILTAVAFCGFLWLGRVQTFSWEPRDQPDRWVIASAFATVMAGLVVAALAWWAGRDTAKPDAQPDADNSIDATTPRQPTNGHVIFGPTTHYGSGDINQSNRDIIISSDARARTGPHQSGAKPPNSSGDQNRPVKNGEDGVSMQKTFQLQSNC